MRRLAFVVAVLLTSLTAGSPVPAREVVPVRVGYIAVAGGGQISSSMARAGRGPRASN